MKREGDTRKCTLDLPCEKKRAEQCILNYVLKTYYAFAYGHTFRNTPDPI